MKFTVFAILIAFVALLGTSPQAVSAQGLGCGWADGTGCSSGGGSHRFYADSGLSQGTPHSECRFCSFGGCHPWCWEEEDQVDAVDLEMIQAQADITRGDLSSLLDRLGVVKKYAVFNEARSAIQLLSCDGDMVVASITVPPAAVAAFLGALQ